MDDKRGSDGWWVVTFVVGVLALIVGVVGVAIASGKSSTSSAAGAAGAAPAVVRVLGNLVLAERRVDDIEGGRERQEHVLASVAGRAGDAGAPRAVSR